MRSYDLLHEQRTRALERLQSCSTVSGDASPEAASLGAIRRQLTVLARRSSARVTEFSKTRPTEWRPYEITSPSSRLPFTDGGAWELIADRLDAGHPLMEVDLMKPLGKKGYVMLIDIGDGKAPIYVKLQLGCRRVIGRSFHRSESGTR